MSPHDFGRLYVVDTILGELCTYADLCRTAVASRCVRELMQSCQGYAYEALLARIILRNGWEPQSVAAVVSESYMLQQIKDTLELRHECLEAVMRSGVYITADDRCRTTGRQYLRRHCCRAGP